MMRPLPTQHQPDSGERPFARTLFVAAALIAVVFAVSARAETLPNHQPIVLTDPAPDQATGTANNTARLPLGTPSTPMSEQSPLGSTTDTDNSASIHWTIRTAGALALVTCLIFALRWLMRKAAGSVGTVRAQIGAGGRAPSGVLFVLARYPITKSSTLVLVRLDKRVLLLSHTSAGFRTLAEITDPSEVASIAGKCNDRDGVSANAAFHAELKRASADPDLAAQRNAAEPDPAQRIGALIQRISGADRS